VDVGTAIEIKHLTKRFGQVVAVDDQSLSVIEGEFLALLGPSGCGKTTLLRCLAGLEEPEEGEIIIGGQTVFSAEKGINVPAGKRKIGMVFQSYALWPHMTVYDNVGFGLQLGRMPKADVRQRVDDVLEDLAMAGLGERYPSELSGGQQQRVALARLLATMPSVFLMDEPLSNLDARLRLDMRSELKRLHFDSGATTVYVTHDQTEALTMASRVAVMQEGKIEQVDLPMNIYKKPANLFVAEFVGMPRINLIYGKAIERDGGTWLEVGPFHLEVPWRLPETALVAAIRPEDIDILVHSVEGAVEFQVYAVLPAGPELFVHLQCGETTLVVRIGSQIKLDMDQQVWVSLELDTVNIYEKDSGELIREVQEKESA
jgi:multiple sugar transport system ATP-binding protein